MRWTMYPPPPGSDPGYHTFHHCIAIGITNTDTKRSVLATSGKKDRWLLTAGFDIIAENPPTAGCPIAYIMPTTAPTMMMTKRKKSVYIAPLNPPSAE